MGVWRRRGLSGALAGMLAMAAGIVAAGERALESEVAGRKPNVVLLLMDTVRADHCSAYGYARDTTPTLDRLAREGVLYRNHLATGGWTLPSILSLFTGLSPVRHGLYDDRNVLPKGTATLASALAAQGYAAIGVTCNPYTAGALGFAEGFDVYDDYSILLDFETNLFGTDHRPPRKVSSDLTGAATVDLALRHLANVPKNKPYFLFVLMFDPHTDYTPPPELARRYDPDYTGFADGRINEFPDDHVFDDPRDLAHVIALYDAEIRYADGQAGRLLEALRQNGRLGDDDLVIYTSDHGEEFNEHGGLRHRRTLHGEILHVPLVIHRPARLPAGVEVDALTAHEDVFPTLARALGWPVRLGGYSPVDLFALARGEAGGTREGAGLRMRWAERDWDGWRTRTHVFLRHRGTGAEEAYALADDPGERRPLAADDPAIPALRRALDVWLAAEAARALSSGATGGKTVLTPKQREALRSMGYVR